MAVPRLSKAHSPYSKYTSSLQVRSFF